MNKTFVSEASEIVWNAFKQTGYIGYYMLFSQIENPPKDLQEIRDEGRDY